MLLNLFPSHHRAISRSQDWNAWGRSWGAAFGASWGSIVSLSRPVVFSRVPLADEPFFDYNRQRREDDSLLLLLL